MEMLSIVRVAAENEWNAMLVPVAKKITDFEPATAPVVAIVVFVVPSRNASVPLV